MVGIGGKVEFRQRQRADRPGGRAGKGEGKDGEHRLAGIAVCLIVIFEVGAEIETVGSRTKVWGLGS